MHKIMKFAVLMVFSGLFLMPAAAQDKPSGAPKTGTTPNSSVSKDFKIEFPEIEGWEKGTIKKYPTPELGYSIAYQSDEGGVVTVYVYNGGLASIPDGINDKIFKAEIDRAKNEIIQVGKAGYYQDVREIKNDTVTLGGKNGKVQALRSLFNFFVKGDEVDSEIYLFGFRNNFIKFRATRPKAVGNSENRALANLFAEMDRLFSS